MQVARLAGLPVAVVNRAKDVGRELEVKLEVCPSWNRRALKCKQSICANQHSFKCNVASHSHALYSAALSRGAQCHNVQE